VSFLLAGFPFSPDWVTNVPPVEGTQGWDGAWRCRGANRARNRIAPVTVTELRTIAMVADKMGEKGAFILCLPDQGKSSFFTKWMWREE